MDVSIHVSILGTDKNLVSQSVKKKNNRVTKVNPTSVSAISSANLISDVTKYLFFKKQAKKIDQIQNPMETTQKRNFLLKNVFIV